MTTESTMEDTGAVTMATNRLRELGASWNALDAWAKTVVDAASLINEGKFHALELKAIARGIAKADTLEAAIYSALNFFRQVAWSIRDEVTMDPERAAFFADEMIACHQRKVA